MSTRLWIPGPTHVRPELLAECARQQIGHRSKAMTALIERLDPGLGRAFGLADGSEARVAVHSCSATALMEGALLGVGPRVLSVTCGAFGERWRKIAELCGKHVVALELPWGSALDPQELDRTLSEQGPFDALTFVSNETSTGVTTHLADVAEVARRHPDVRVLVDLVSYIAGAAVDFDANGLDFAFAGVQKAFALPSGITVACASRRYLEHAAELERRSFYLDPVRVFDGHAERKTISTPTIPLYYALAAQLDDIDAGVVLPAAERGDDPRANWSARFAVHARMREATRAWAERHGLERLPPDANASPTVSCIRAGAVDVPALIAGLKRRGHEIGNGYGRLKNETFRIGHMGDHTERDLDELLAAADETLREGAAG